VTFHSIQFINMASAVLPNLDHFEYTGEKCGS
jgi:hypothetical protein